MKLTRMVDFTAHHRLVAPSLVSPPGGRLVAGILLGRLTEAFVGLATSFELLDGGVGRYAGEKGRKKGTGLENLRHVVVVGVGELLLFFFVKKSDWSV